MLWLVLVTVLAGSVVFCVGVVAMIYPLSAEQPDRTLAELKDALGTPASLATIWRAVAALDVTVKKTVRPSERPISIFRCGERQLPAGMS